MGRSTSICCGCWKRRPAAGYDAALEAPQARGARSKEGKTKNAQAGPPIDWLLEGEPWIEYNTRVHLLGQPESHPLVRASRSAMLAAPLIRQLIAELSNWPGTVIASHKSAGQPFHRLTFLAELGIRAKDPGVGTIVERIEAHRAEEGPFQLPMRIDPAYGGDGKERWGWALCDAPLVLYGLVRLGRGNEPAVKAAIRYLAKLVRDNGWPCVVSKEAGGFRGPGRKEDPCPFATLAMLKLMGASNELRNEAAAQAGTESLLHLWHKSTTQHPYIFHMGTDFRKLKVPFVWYDILHVLNVLSEFAWTRDDPRLRDMAKVMERKADGEGRFRVESLWTAWKGWEFGQKKDPSRWLTLQAWRVLGRLDGDLHD